jgi:hypothetical protein
MNNRPGMSCSDNHLTDQGMHAASSNDDTVDPYSAADLMGTTTWLDYVERWNPLRYVPPPLGQKTKSRRYGR